MSVLIFLKIIVIKIVTNTFMRKYNSLRPLTKGITITKFKEKEGFTILISMNNYGSSTIYTEKLFEYKRREGSKSSRR